MLSRIKGIFAPPVFPEDEDKTRLARVLNSLLFYTIAYLAIYGIIVIPFFLTEKLFYGIAEPATSEARWAPSQRQTWKRDFISLNTGSACELSFARIFFALFREDLGLPCLLF